MKEPIIAGVDVGSSHVRTVIARISEGSIDVIGIGEHESAGIRKGIIINIDVACQVIAKSTEQAELMAGLQLEDVIVSINGEHIKGLNSKGVIGVNSKNKEITQLEIDRVLESAKNIHLPLDREIIEAIEQEYSLDGQDEIKSPIGMAGTRLEADIHIITGLKYVAENLKKTLNKIKFSGKDVITAVRASAEAVLKKDEKDLGVALIDIGHSTTSIIVYIEGAVWHTVVLPVGGQHITNDISAGLRVTAQTAESLKCDYGTTYIDLVSSKEIMEVPTPNGQTRIVPKKVLTEIIQPRVEEILSMIVIELKKINCLDLLASGLVFTGGTALLPGLTDLAENYKLDDNGSAIISARIGTPDTITGITDIAQNPAYSTVIGLLQMSLNEATDVNIPTQKPKTPETKPKSFKGLFKKNPFSEFFG